MRAADREAEVPLRVGVGPMHEDERVLDGVHGFARERDRGDDRQEELAGGLPSQIQRDGAAVVEQGAEFLQTVDRGVISELWHTLITLF